MVMDELELERIADATELQIFAVTGDMELAEKAGKLIRTGVLTERHER
jgi:hypothetical protein